MARATGSSFDVVDEMLAQQAASMRQFDREMARVERGVLNQMLSMERQTAPRVHMHDDIRTGQHWRVYEREGGWRGTGSLSFYSERYAVSQPVRQPLPPRVQSTQGSPIASGFLVAAAFAAGLWAVLSALLVRNHGRTAYAPESRLTLLALWPLLLLTSPSFRGQFARAVGWTDVGSPTASTHDSPLREDEA